jgi:hypothetical protein
MYTARPSTSLHTTASPAMDVAQLFPATVRVRAVVDQATQPANSGFFYLYAGRLFLVTNRHILVAPAGQSRRDTLRITLHTNADDLTRYEELRLPLYDQSGKARWLEHPGAQHGVDVAALLVDRAKMAARFFVRAFRQVDHVPAGRHIHIGATLTVVGFPDGLYDTRRNMPVAQPAGMASMYPAAFGGRKVAVVDGPRLPRGTSGGPVLAEMEEDGRRYHLVGVYSTADPGGVWPGAHPSGLGWVWFASLIPEILEQSGRPDGHSAW